MCVCVCVLFSTLEHRNSSVVPTQFATSYVVRLNETHAAGLIPSSPTVLQEQRIFGRTRTKSFVVLIIGDSRVESFRHNSTINPSLPPSGIEGAADLRVNPNKKFLSFDPWRLEGRII